MSGRSKRAGTASRAKLTLHVFPAPSGDRVVVAVTEGRTAAGEFAVTASAWQRARQSFNPGRGVRIVDYPR